MVSVGKPNSWNCPDIGCGRDGNLGDGAVYRPVVPVPSGPDTKLFQVPEVRSVGNLSRQYLDHRNLHLRIYGRIQFIVYGRER